ncbi:MAG: penicillin-binding protein 2 [Alphaproteobacteria bacterium]|nr:MAG: penicillin-binding protein 2 [Alphaproteobacteria bacterium]
MVATPYLDDNPCRPRHFKPPPCVAIISEGPAMQALEACRSRLLITAVLFALVFVVVGLRVAEIALFEGGAAQSQIGRFRAVRAPAPSHADIVDRNVLATTLDSPSLYAVPKQILDPTDATSKIVRVFPKLSSADVHTKLTSGKSFVWIKRHLTPREQYDINQLGIPGLEFEHEERRIYPGGSLTSHVVGYAGIDNAGFAGVERALDDVLKERREPLPLSLDLRLQYILREELQRVIDDFTAKGGAGLIMDVNTGEILAMASLPDFDPNRPATPDPNHPGVSLVDRMFNRNTLGVYELGSIFKIFTVAMALDAGTSTLTSTYDASHPIAIGRFTISDYHGKHRVLNVPEILMYSSNIGAARMAIAAGAQKQREFLARLGLLRKPKIEISEVGAPHYPAKWREVNVMTIAFGHGISVTPLSFATAAAALVNGGVLRQATLVKLPPGHAPQGQQVISAKTSDQMRRLMRLVVERGTGTMAAAPGYLVGGKTGTADKVSGRHYADRKLLSSFVGFFPINAPKYLVLAMVDEPHPNKQSHGYATAGWTVAPATSRIVQRIAPVLGVQPVDEASPEVQRALLVESLQGKRLEAY